MNMNDGCILRSVGNTGRTERLPASAGKPLFTNLDDAMKFAWQTPHSEHRDTLARWLKAPGRRFFSVDLDPLPRGEDAATQRGMIKSYVRGMAPHHRAHLQAKYAWGRERHEARQALAERVLATLATGVHKRRLVYELVARCYGGPVALRELAARYRLHPNSITQYRKRVGDAIGAITVAAESQAIRDLQQGGLIL